jgi:hypothetical protein
MRLKTRTDSQSLANIRFCHAIRTDDGLRNVIPRASLGMRDLLGGSCGASTHVNHRSVLRVFDRAA